MHPPAAPSFQPSSRCCCRFDSPGANLYRDVHVIILFLQWAPNPAGPRPRPGLEPPGPPGLPAKRPGSRGHSLRTPGLHLPWVWALSPDLPAAPDPRQRILGLFCSSGCLKPGAPTAPRSHLLGDSNQLQSLKSPASLQPRLRSAWLLSPAFPQPHSGQHPDLCVDGLPGFTPCARAGPHKLYQGAEGAVCHVSLRL